MGDGGPPNAQGAPVGHPTWAGRVAVPKRYLRRGATIEDTALRGITSEQLANLEAVIKDVLGKVEIVETDERSPLYGKRLTWENVDMYSVCKYFVKPLTEPHQCSFVDLVATAEAQPPKWFVSHAWSTPFSQTVAMLEFQRRSRGLPPTTPYWICTFATGTDPVGRDWNCDRALCTRPALRAVHFSLGFLDGVLNILQNTSEILASIFRKDLIFR